MSPNDADGIANSVDPDQTADLGLHCLLRPIYLSENLGSLRVTRTLHITNYLPMNNEFTMFKPCFNTSQANMLVSKALRLSFDCK